MRPCQRAALAPRENWCSHLEGMLTSFPWDLAAILLLLGVLVPWRGAVRVRVLLTRSALSSAERIAIYASTIAFQWILTALTVWRCIARGWSLASLGIALANRPLALGVGLALASALGLIQLVALRQLRHVPPEQRGRLPEIARKLMPQNLTEALPFVALVCTVSLCEEFLYRGFVFSVFQRVLGGSALGAILGSSILFGIGHFYQGRRGMINTFVLGAIFAAVRFWSGSLAPSILVHLAVDLVAGLGGTRWATSQNQAEASAAGVSGNAPTSNT
jgi:membrane protease YdiL (CAAX protease family)